MRNQTNTALSAELRSKDVNRMLMPEDLARIRWQELSREADLHRLANRLSRRRWWLRVAEYAATRAKAGELTN